MYNSMDLKCIVAKLRQCYRNKNKKKHEKIYTNNNKNNK